MRIIEHNPDFGFRPNFTVLPPLFTAFSHLPFLISQVLGFLIPVFHVVKERTPPPIHRKRSNRPGRPPRPTPTDRILALAFSNVKSGNALKAWKCRMRYSGYWILTPEFCFFGALLRPNVITR